MSRRRGRAAESAAAPGSVWETTARIGRLEADRYLNVRLLHDPGASGADRSRVDDLRRVGEHLGDPAPFAAPLVVIAPVLGPQGVDLSAEMAGWLGEIARETGVSEIRLVAEIEPAATAQVHAGLHRFVDATGVRLLAPHGRLLEVPGNTLFPIAGAGEGTWRRFVPGHARPLPAGPWSFTAQWHADLSLLPSAGLVAGLRVMPVPAGVLLLPEGVEPPGIDDVVYSVPVEPGRPLVMVRHSIDLPVRAESVVEYLVALPGQVRGRVQLTAAAEPVPTSDWQEIAELLEEEITVLTGLPLDYEGVSVVSVLDVTAAGEPEVRWRPPATHLVYTPSYGGRRRPPRVLAARSLNWPQDLRESSAGSDPQRPNSVFLRGSWELEIVPCGFVLRKSIGHSDEDLPEAGIFDPAGPTILSQRPADADAEGFSHVIERVQETVLRECGQLARIRSCDQGPGTPVSGLPMMRSR